ncbi:MAG: hypothetical protein QM589_03920 [Thermomicrobiales bacterium]
MRRIVARAAFFVVPAGMSLLLLAGCGSSGSNVPDDRQFASSAKTAPAAETTPTVTAAPPTAQAATSGQPAQASNPFSTRGAPSDAFVWDGQSLTIIGLSGEEPVLTRIVPELVAGEIIRDAVSAPSGDRFAVLTSDAVWSPSSLKVSLYARDGRPVASPLGVASTPATPVASPVGVASPVATPASPEASGMGDGTGARLVALPSSLTWAPSGDRLVVNVAGSSVAVLGVDDSGLAAGATIAIPPEAGTMAGAWLSPRGDSLLLVLTDARGSRAIATVSLAGTDRRPHVVWPGTDERRTKSIREAAWLPDGTGIVFTTDQGGATGSGNLYEVRLTNLEPRVLATAGRAGPSARVGMFAMSPDGKSIAYTLETPDGDGWSFHSLWVRSIRDGSSVEVSTANGAEVSQPVWTSRGLLWEQSSADGSHAELVLATSDGTSRTIAMWNGERWAIAGVPAASPQASPAASPATSPQASPAASPARSPVATPEASPAGSPKASPSTPESSPAS